MDEAPNLAPGVKDDHSSGLYRNITNPCLGDFSYSYNLEFGVQ